jgi:hypothetical protein
VLPCAISLLLRWEGRRASVTETDVADRSFASSS